MKVILLKSVQKVGKKDEVVEVAAGFAQHALFPKKLAIAATPSALAALKTHQANVVPEKNMQHVLLDKAIAAIAAASFIYKAKANEQGNLFSKIDTDDIAHALMDQMRISLDPKKMHIVEGVIKQVGTYTVNVQDGDYRARFEVVVQKE